MRPTDVARPGCPRGIQLRLDFGQPGALIGVDQVATQLISRLLGSPDCLFEFGDPDLQRLGDVVVPLLGIFQVAIGGNH